MVPYEIHRRLAYGALLHRVRRRRLSVIWFTESLMSGVQFKQLAQFRVYTVP
jgi:hypothetical protein